MIEDRSKMVRAKAVKDGVWVYGEVVTRSDGKVFINQVSKDLFVDNELDNDNIQSGEFNFVEVDKDTLCAFMGFYDRNIQPIYENDIVSRYGTNCNKCLSAMGFNEEERKRYFYHCPIVDKIKECPQYEVMRDVVSGKRFRYWLENEHFGYEGEALVDNFEFKKCEDDVERWVISDCKVIGNTFDDKYINFYIGD